MQEFVDLTSKAGPLLLIAGNHKVLALIQKLEKDKKSSEFRFSIEPKPELDEGYCPVLAKGNGLFDTLLTIYTCFHTRCSCSIRWIPFFN